MSAAAPVQIPPYEEQTDLAMTCAVLGITFEDLKAELDYRMRQKMAKLEREMALAAKAGGVRRTLPDDGHGGGEVQYILHPISFHYWGRRLGYECWQDDQFVREYLRDNPAARVKSVARNTTVTVDDRFRRAKNITPMRPRITSTRGRGRWAAA